MKMISSPWGIGQRSPNARSGIIHVKPGYIAPVMSNGISPNNVKLVVMDDQSGRASLPARRYFWPLYPFLCRRVECPDMVGRGFIGKTVILKCTYHPNEALIFSGLKMIEFHGRGIYQRAPRISGIVVNIQGTGIFTPSHQVKLIACLNEGTLMAGRIVFVLVFVYPRSAQNGPGKTKGLCIGAHTITVVHSDVYIIRSVHRSI